MTFPKLLGKLGKHNIHVMICFHCPEHNLYASVFFGVNLTPGCFSLCKTYQEYQLLHIFLNSVVFDVL